MRIGRIVVALVALPLAAGCMVVVDGAAHPAPGLAPRPLIGKPGSHALLDDSELAKLLRQYFKSKPQSPPRFGGRDQLYDVLAAPSGRSGVVYELQKSSYGAADVENVAQQTWWTAGIRGAKVISLVESVAAVPTAAAADAVFAGFIRQWEVATARRSRQIFGSVTLSPQPSAMSELPTLCSPPLCNPTSSRRLPAPAPSGSGRIALWKLTLHSSPTTSPTGLPSTSRTR
jgi:hypothetical protein